MKQLDYRFFPIPILGFFRVANAVGIGLVIPLYYLNLGYTPDLIGLLSSAMTITYIFSTILFNKIAKKWNYKISLIISSVAMFLIQLTFQFDLDPYFFLIMRLIEGIFLGLFWPVLSASISLLTSIESVENDETLKNRIMRTYTFSWNSGGIFGFLVGTILLFVISDLELIFDVSLLYSLIILIISLFFVNPKQYSYSSSIDTLVKNPSTDKKNQNENLGSIPLFLSIATLLLYGFIGNSFKFLYPIKSELLDLPLFTNYLLSFILSTSQLIFTTYGMSFSLKWLKKLTLVSLLINVATFFVLFLSSNLIIFGALFVSMGMSVSFLYIFSFKTIISKNVLEKTSKYSYYFESTIGGGFFLGPVISGFLANIGLNFALISFVFLSMIILVSFLLLLKLDLF
ncbi:MAG: MFS transporter [Candidatus Lokiarchaeota archaeon]|nr:MFS transporter [Candidatus Lokiarchaeota archaeon]MBD3200712.1 MFS transporter [Candidatus Lokiarchaeota archaeon]